MQRDAAYMPFIRSSSYRLREGCAARPLVDGEPAFRRICQADKAARKRVWVTVAVLHNLSVGLLLLGSCDDALQCHAVLCQDSLSLSLRPADHTWESGSYTFEFTLDRDQHTCKVELSGALPDIIEAGQPELSCSPRLSAWFSNATCSEQTWNDPGGCAPVRDRWLVRVDKAGTPKDLKVRVQRDDASILEVEQRVTYLEDEPNGPGCGVCRQRHLEFEVD